MTIQEAIKSGKRFRRPWMRPGNYYVAQSDIIIRGYETTEQTPSPEMLTVTEILADDWGIEEEKVEITEYQLLSAIREIILGSSINLYEAAETAKKQLGFKS